MGENVKKVHKFQTAYNELLKDYLKDGLLTVYTAGFIDMKKQYLTIGVNGVIEAAEFLGIPVNDNPTYREFMQSILKTISDENRKARTKELMFNTEFVPKTCGHVKPNLIDLEPLRENRRQQGASVMAA